MFEVNFSSLISGNTPEQWKDNITLMWLRLLVSPVRIMYKSFLKYRSDALYKLSFTGQIIYLEHMLNDSFDTINRGIYINNVADLHAVYLYNKSETRPPTYMYNKHKMGKDYLAGQFAVDSDGNVYVAKYGNTDKRPSIYPGYWEFYKKNLVFKNKSENVLYYDFIIMVPSTVVFDRNKMIASVNYYRHLGARYTIKTY